MTTVYCIKGVRGSSAIKIKYLDTIDTSQVKLTDTPVDGHEITTELLGEQYACNITNTYLATFKKLPMLYINVSYLQSIRKVLLYRLFVYFTVEDKNIGNYNELLKKAVEGKFSLELVTFDETDAPITTILDDDIGTFNGNDKLMNKLKEFMQSTDMLEYCAELILEDNEKSKKQYGKELEYFVNIPVPTIRIKK